MYQNCTMGIYEAHEASWGGECYATLNMSFAVTKKSIAIHINCRPVINAPFDIVEVVIYAPSDELQIIFCQVVLGKMPYPVFADYLEDHKDEFKLKELRSGDWESMLSLLRHWHLRKSGKCKEGNDDRS